MDGLEGPTELPITFSFSIRWEGGPVAVRDSARPDAPTGKSRLLRLLPLLLILTISCNAVALTPGQLRPAKGLP
jgi:hypothetical protein